MWFDVALADSMLCPRMVSSGGPLPQLLAGRRSVGKGDGLTVMNACNLSSSKPTHRLQARGQWQILTAGTRCLC